MCLVVYLLQALDTHVRIYLRCTQPGVPQGSCRLRKSAPFSSINVATV